MTLDEAIKRSEEVMVENIEKTKGRNASDPIAINCFECAGEHRQLAEWLKDYKRLLEQEPCEDCISRQAVLDLVADYDLSMGQVVRGIHALLSVKPQEPSITWVTGADGAKIAFWDVPVWKVTKICEILGEPQERSE